MTAEVSEIKPETRFRRAVCRAGNRSFRGPPLYLFGGILLGFLALPASGLWPFMLLPLFAFGYGAAPSKKLRALFVFSYYMGAGVLPMSATFDQFWPRQSPYIGLTAFAIAALMAAPWWLVGAFGNETPRNISNRFAFSLLITSVPPLGAWALFSPLSVSGIAFPDMGIFGLFLSAVLLMVIVLLTAGTLRAPHGARQEAMAALYDECKPILLVLVSLSVISNAAYKAPALPPHFYGVSLHWPSLPKNVSFWKNVARQQRVAQQVRHSIDSLPPHSTILLPENIDGFYFPNFLSTAFAQQMATAARARQDTVLVGADDAVLKKDSRDWRYIDALNAYGKHSGVFASRQPIPLGEWKPWEKGSAIAYWWRVGPYYLGHRPFALAVCYSQLPVWPLASYFLDPAARRPAWIFAPENHDWETGERKAGPYSENHLQNAYLKLWGRLYGVPVLKANDTPMPAHP